MDHIPNQKRFYLSDILFYALLVLIIVGALALSADQSERKSLFGYRIYNVLSSSMQEEIPKGSLVLVKQVQLTEIEVGNDITFFSDSTGKVITHRVIEIMENKEEQQVPGFRTQGVSNPEPDDWIVYGKNVIGRAVWHLPFAGFVLDYIANHLILTALILVMLVCLGSVLMTLIRKQDEENHEDEEDKNV